jgi:hypothetical protein
MGSGGKQPLDQLLASGAAHLRCYVRRRKRVDGDRAKAAEELARATCVNSYRGGPLLCTNPPGVPEPA